MSKDDVGLVWSLFFLMMAILIVSQMRSKEPCEWLTGEPPACWHDDCGDSTVCAVKGEAF